ncbi:MAG: SLC13/DASS family transporter [Planctomycetales bacterium]|nr:SLC13/DASS family transporter [Planctomycetales bacterium]
MPEPITEANDSPTSWPRRLGLVAGPVFAVLLIFGPQFGWSLDAERPQLNAMAAILVWMALWWITEAIPIAATALLPLVLFPLLRIPPGGQIALNYANPLIFLFFGGFLLALAVEDSGLHRRIALMIIVAVGDNPRRVVLGFMIATATLSMWISNTATTMLLLPIAMSVLAQAEREATDARRVRRFGVCLMLGLAYGASIGGVATLIGTPPNIAFQGMFEKLYPEATPISFFAWMKMALPFSICFLFVAWALLTYVVQRLGGESFLGGRDLIAGQLRALGPMSAAEWRMLVIFGTTALLWITREPVAGWGWSPALRLDQTADGTKLANDGTVAMAMALLCFLVPAQGAGGKKLLDWEATSRLPWGILFLFGGGLALAAGMTSTGLSEYLGRALAARMASMSMVGMMLATTFGMTFLTEVTSNLASVNMLLPILAGSADALGVAPQTLMIPATLAASSAFMLPVATPPNAIVYGSGKLRMADMIQAGLWLNLIGALLVVAFVFLLAP